MKFIYQEIPRSRSAVVLFSLDYHNRKYPAFQEESGESLPTRRCADEKQLQSIWGGFGWRKVVQGGSSHRHMHETSQLSQITIWFSGHLPAQRCLHRMRVSKDPYKTFNSLSPCPAWEGVEWGKGNFE